ncbi:MAG: hypothetical protein SH809_03215 [Rhodothermales bacterium]|nr:hypothetical protein [Rhodothermales bacterium]
MITTTLRLTGFSTETSRQTPALRAPLALGLFALLVVLKLAPALTPLVYLGLALQAWRGPKETIQALTLLFVVLNLNPGLFGAHGQGASLRWLVLMSALGRTVWDGVLGGKPWPARILQPLLLFAGAGVVLALVGSRLPTISVFKLAAFTMGAVAILTSFYRTTELTEYWMAWFTTCFLTILVVSLPLYLFPAGFFSNGRGFQGVLAHPQLFGPVAAPLTAWLIARALFEGERSPVVLVGIALGLMAVFTSQARTGALMIAGSLLAVAAFTLFRGQLHRARPTRRGMPALGLILALVVCVASVARGDALLDRAMTFVQKRVETGASASIDIRAMMIERQLENFWSSPLTGIGFGLPSNATDWARISTGFLGLPTGFTAEKGFMPSSVLEETGLIGAILLVFVLLALAGPIYRHGSPPLQALFLAALLANAGEMIFFSFGGAGLYYWLMYGWCYANARRPGDTRFTGCDEYPGYASLTRATG